VLWSRNVQISARSTEKGFFREEEESRREHKPVDKKTEEPVEKPSEKPPVQEEETIQEDKIQGETDNWENLEYAHIPQSVEKVF